MPYPQTTDPRAQRTQAALQESFKKLLKQKPLQKISVKEITEGAGIARHTFYNHYETKQDLLNQLIDSVLDDFFSGLGNWDFYNQDEEEELAMYCSFFQAWKDNSEISKLILAAEIDSLIIGRLKEFFTRYYYQRVRKVVSDVQPAFAEYIINFNAYTLLAIIKPWFKRGLRYPPEIMAGLLMQLTGSEQRMKAIEKYKGVFK